jgi:hypothetical protein
MGAFGLAIQIERQENIDSPDIILSERQFFGLFRCKIKTAQFLLLLVLYVCIPVIMLKR